MKFYTNFTKYGNEILYRGFDNGARIMRRVKYKPSLFVPTTENTEWKTLENNSVKKITFDTMREANDFLEKYKDVNNFKIYGNDRFHYSFISDEFKESVEYDISKIVIANIDIEINSSNGMPSVMQAPEEITSITMKCEGKFYVYGVKNYINNREDVIYYHAEDEVSMLKKFLNDWVALSPDIVTGWYINLFDIPYLVNRIEIILGSNYCKKLSPWGLIKKRLTTVKGKENVIIEMLGVTILDYIELYKKFAPNHNQPSYKLNYISHVELNEKKVSYTEYSSLHEMYDKDFQKFIDYNIQDVELVDKLEKKMQLITMVLSVAYEAKVNYLDVYTQVRMWDCIIFNNFRKKKVVLPPNKFKNKSEKYEGAFVKDPQVGLHDWVVSFDVNSQYPNLICWANISPETIVDDASKVIDIDNLIDMKYDLSYLQKENLSMTANGEHFTRTKMGFLPEIILGMLNTRTAAKKEMLHWQDELEKINQELKKRNY